MKAAVARKWVSAFLVWMIAFSGLLILVPMVSATTYSGTSGLAPSTETNTVYYNTTLNGGFGQPGNAYWWGQNFTGTSSFSSSVNSTAYCANLSIASTNGYTEDTGGSSGTYFKFSFVAYVRDGSGPYYGWFSNQQFGNAYGDYQIENAQINSVYQPPYLVYVNITNGPLSGAKVLGCWDAYYTDWGTGSGYQYLTLNPTWHLSQAGVGGNPGGNASQSLAYNITVIYDYSSSVTLTTNPAMFDTFANAASGVNNETNTYATPTSIFFGYGFTNPAGAIPISQASATYPISLSGVPSGTGYYQQLLTIDNPTSYGINTAGSNIQFTAGNGTLLYAWVQSINSTSMQVWVKNYNDSSIIDIQIFPTFENLFSANGYLGEAPQLSSTYAQYDNGKYVFVNYWNFAGTTLPSSFTTAGTSSGSYSQNNGITLSDSSYLYEIITPISSGNITVNSLMELNSSTNGNIAVGYGGGGTTYPLYNSYELNFASAANNMYKYSSGTSSEIAAGSYSLATAIYSWAVSTSPSQNAYQNYTLKGSGTDSSLSLSNFNQLAIGVASGGSIRLTWLNTITYLSSMPTFTIGSLTNVTDADASYLSNSITIPMPNWFNLTLKAYTNYSFTFQYNNTPLYFTYDGLINNTIYTGFLDSNITLDIHFIALGYSGKTELIVGEKT